MRRRFRFCLALVLLVVLSGCADDRLSVLLQTDLRAGIDFVRADVTLISGEEELFSVHAARNESYLGYVTVAEFSAERASGVLVILRDVSGAEVARRRVERASSNAELRVQISFGCAGLNCESDACLAGECVDATCRPFDRVSCPTTPCRSDSQCASAGCAEAVCLGGECYRRPYDSRCESGRCSLDGECAMGPIDDAGVDAADVGPDSGEDAGEDADNDGGEDADSGDLDASDAADSAFDAADCNEGEACVIGCGRGEVRCDPPRCELRAPRPFGTVCREAAGDCDGQELCDGRSMDCPEDGVSLRGEVCRASTGPCDVEEVCDGVRPSCPADARTTAGEICREARGPCDAAERCDGESHRCPVDERMAPGTVCRAATAACDRREFCTGARDTCPADTFFAEGRECRAAASDCDQVERCTGTSPRCPEDEFADRNARCDDDNACTTRDRCDGRGACVPAASSCGGACDPEACAFDRAADVCACS